MIARTVALLLLLATPAAAEPLVGLYPGGSPWSSIAEADRVRDALEPTAVRLAYLGDFVDPDWPLEHVRLSLDATWETGAVYVMNLMTTTTLQPLAFPRNDAEWARSNRYYALAAVIRAWGEACGPHCRMILVPYPEMNGNWTAYGEQPRDFIEAFGKLRYVLWQMDALKYVQMAWAPNVASSPEQMRPYMPPRAWVDLVGCSAYHVVTGPFSVEACFAQLRALMPGKPILLAQTGACRPNNETFATALVGYLKRQPDALGYLWFAYDKAGECDWRLSPAAWRRAVLPLDPRVP
jgi:hypothetical protein